MMSLPAEFTDCAPCDAAVCTDPDALRDLATKLEIPLAILKNLGDKPLSVRWVRNTQRVLRALADCQERQP